MKITQNINIESARIGFRNFAGKEGKFNRAGARNFCVFLDTDIAKLLETDGWNIKWLTPKDEEEDLVPYIQVAVAFGNIPPKIIMITSRGKTPLTEDEINILDWAEIENVDLIIRPYNWEVNGKSGVKAYVKAMYITIREDEFEYKYMDVPTSAQNALDEEEDVVFPRY